VFTTRLEAVFVVPKLAALWSVLALSLAVIAGGVLLSGRLLHRARPLLAADGAVAAFVVLNLVAWAYSTDRRQSLYGERLQYQGLLTLLLYVGFFYVARLSLTDLRRTRSLLVAVAVGATLVSAYAIVQKAGLDPIWEGSAGGGRVFSSIGQSNALAAYLVVALPLSAALLVGAKPVWRSALVVAVAGMVAALAFTSSRGGLLGLLAVLAVLAVGWRRRLGLSARRVASGLAAVLIALAVILALGEAARETAADSWRRAASSAGDESVRFHLDAWTVAARIAADHPVLGTGQETFPNLFPHYSHELLPAERAAALDAFRVESPHDVYLAVAAGAGFPALVAYLGILAAFVLVSVRAARAATPELGVVLVALLAAAAGHLATDAFMTADVTSTWLFWVSMGAGLALSAAVGRRRRCVSQAVA
jgi:O-antigen ligase